ncbi:hypothetical protein pb186bvf_012884 [Paramecium bursaria]
MGNNCCQISMENINLGEIPVYRQHYEQNKQSSQLLQTSISEPRIFIKSFQELDSSYEVKSLKKKKKQAKPYYRPTKTDFLDPLDDLNYYSSDDNNENEQVENRNGIDLRFRRECLLSVEKYRSVEKLV